MDERDACPVCHEPLAGKVTRTRLPCRPGKRPAVRYGHERADGRWCAFVEAADDRDGGTRARGGPCADRAAGATIAADDDADARQTAASDDPDARDADAVCARARARPWHRGAGG